MPPLEIAHDSVSTAIEALDRVDDRTLGIGLSAALLIAVEAYLSRKSSQESP